VNRSTVTPVTTPEETERQNSWHSADLGAAGCAGQHGSPERWQVDAIARQSAKAVAVSVAPSARTSKTEIATLIVMIDVPKHNLVGNFCVPTCRIRHIEGMDKGKRPD